MNCVMLIKTHIFSAILICCILFYRCVVEVLRTFCTMVPTFVSWFTECEKMLTSAAFRAMCGIDCIIGTL